MKIIQFLPHNGTALFRRRLRNPRGVAEEEDDDPATQPSGELFVKAHVPPQAVLVAPQQHRRHRIVRFAEQHNQVYEAACGTTKEECAALWYTGPELQQLRQQHRQDVFDLRHLEEMLADEQPVTWGKSFIAVYQSFCQQHSRTQAAGAAQLPACKVDIFTVGMEKRAILPIAADTARRRQALSKAVLQCQDALKQHAQNNAKLCDDMLRQVSRQMSRPSRLFARHVAAVSAATEL